MASFSISYWDWIKFPYYADTTEKGDRGWKRAQRQGEDTVTLGILKSITLKKILKSYHTKGLRASQSSCDSTLFTKLQCYIGFVPWAWWNLNFFLWFSCKALLLSILNLFFKRHFWECVDWKPILEAFFALAFTKVFIICFYVVCILWGQLSPIIFSIRCLTLVI